MLEDMYDMSRAAADCVKKGVHVDEEGNLISGKFPRSFNDLEAYQQDAVVSILESPARAYIRPLNLQYIDGAVRLSGEFNDLDFVTPLLQHAMYELGMDEPVFFKSSETKDTPATVIAVGMEGWSMVPIDSFINDPCNSLRKLIERVEGKDCAERMFNGEQEDTSPTP